MIGKRVDLDQKIRVLTDLWEWVRGEKIRMLMESEDRSGAESFQCLAGNCKEM